MPTQRDEFGLRGEQLAEQHLLHTGLKFLARRYRTPIGELDLVFLDRRTVVFVEVKTQKDRRFSEPHERVRADKQRKLLKAAQWFLNKRRLTDRPCRFDVVSVIVPADGPHEVRHIQAAFLPER